MAVAPIAFVMSSTPAVTRRPQRSAALLAAALAIFCTTVPAFATPPEGPAKPLPLPRFVALALDTVAAMVYDETPPADLARETDRIAELRASGHVEELSRLGGLTAQFEPGAF